MSLKRNVSLATALRYNGQGPMLAFILHRIGGIGMAVFITMHILASFLEGASGLFEQCLRALALSDLHLFRVLSMPSTAYGSRSLTCSPGACAPARGDLGGMGSLHPAVCDRRFVIISTADG